MAAALLLLFSAAAEAGDGAALRVIGFSPDAARFAFEQFGAHDASGFPYSQLAVIDTATGADAEGGPFSSLIENDQADVAAAQTATAVGARPVLERLRIGTDGMVSAANPAIRPAEELLPMDIWPVMADEVAEMELPISALGPGTVRITQRPAPNPFCARVERGEEATAITLTLTRAGGAPMTLHADGDLPPARICAAHYGIAGLYLHLRPDGAVALVVILSFYPRGFEGPDRRFLAFSARVPRG
jgi:predicted secreted protein